MSTQCQITANQSNAQHSSGPKSAEGKAVSAMNNFRHGFTGAFRILRWESQQEFDELHRALRDEHRPTTMTETILVDKMAQALWLSKRAAEMQHELFNDLEPQCDRPNQLALYLRYQTTNERIFHKSLAELLKLRAEKRKQEIGFESQARKNEEHAIKKAAENRKQERHRWDILLAEAKVDHQKLQSLNIQIAKSAQALKENRSLTAAQ